MKDFTTKLQSHVALVSTAKSTVSVTFTRQRPQFLNVSRTLDKTRLFWSSDSFFVSPSHKNKVRGVKCGMGNSCVLM